MTQLVKVEPGPLMPHLIKSEPEISSSDEDSIAALLKALTTLNPAVKTNLIQSILGAGEFPTMSASDSPPRRPIGSPVKSNAVFVPTTVLQTSVPISYQISSSPTMSSSSPVICSSAALISHMQNQPKLLPRSKTSPLIPTSRPLVPTSSSLIPVSRPPTSSPLNPTSTPTTLTSSLPQLVPVSSDFTPLTSHSLVAAPATTSVMDSGSPTSRAGSMGVGDQIDQMISDVLTGTRNSSSPFLNTSSSQQMATSPSIDRSSTDSEDQLNVQSRKLADQLAAVRSRILLSGIENTGANSQYLAQLVKLEQVIHLLQEAVVQRQVRAVQPSVILGGNRSPEQGTNNTVYYSGYDTVGVKRKSSPKSAQKSGKKIKHSGGSHGIQLWQFILELLGDSEQRPVLAWTGNGLEFRIINSVELARLWGIRKRNPIMNFDKLSRALRYYYEKNIIKHNPMHRLVYSFCNNPDDMVYNALLNRALATCPIDPELAKQQVGVSPYQWQDNLGKVPSSIKVTLQAVRNKMNGVMEEEKFPLSVNNS